MMDGLLVVTGLHRKSQQSLKILSQTIGALWGQKHDPNLMSLSGEMQFPLLVGWLRFLHSGYQEAEESKNVSLSVISRCGKKG